MGAEFWRRQTAFHPDPESALHQVQVEVFRKAGYQLAKLLDERIKGVADSIQTCEHEDTYDLREYYRDALQRLRQLADRGVPDDVADQIALLRKVEAVSSDDAPGVLALVGVSERWESGGKARLMKQHFRHYDSFSPQH